jgi:hypothetical protein
MRSPTDERGSTLILLIGIVATLAIMAVALVTLTANVGHNTMTERSRTKTFAVTEAALDKGMYTLSRNWPSAVTDQTTFDVTEFSNDFPANQWPRPTSGSFVTVTYFDNPDLTPTGGWPVGYSAANPPPWDANGDNNMYVVAQANSGSTKGRVQAKVQRTFLEITVPHGVALCAGGNLLSNGGGNNPKISVEVAPPTGTETAIHVGGFIDDPTVTTSGIAQYTGANASSVDTVFPASLVSGLVVTAGSHGREFDSQAAAEASPVDPDWAPSGGMSGLCVIHAAVGSTVLLKDDYNSEASPGMLLVLGGGNIDFGGNGNYYGIVYCDGPIDKGHGTFTIHGMAVTRNTDDMRGTVDIKYNDNCIARLQNNFPTNVKLVNNTWRELTPQ